LMIGRRLINKIAVLFFAIACLIGPSILLADSQQPIVILVSNDEEAYSAPISSFIAEVNLPVEIRNLKGDVGRAPDVMAEIINLEPQLIFALGAKAAVVSKVWTADHPEIPVIFAMVLNWERYDLIGRQGNVAGIAYDVAPGTHLANLSMLSPEINKVGVIYSREHSSQFMESARKSAEILNLKLVEKVIANPQEFERAFKGMEDKIDSYWILPDPIVYTLENISWLERRCLNDRIICLGPSENVAKLGIVLSVDPDQKNMGSQAASITKSILQYNQKPGRIGVMSPIGTRLFINLKTANKIGLQISRNALDQATKIIDR
jgi:putative ABC transport system substrate-binding protein